MAGTSCSTNFSYSGYHQRSVSGGELQCPPDGSGFTLNPTKPSSFTHPSSSPTQFEGGTPGDCGSCPTGMKLSGKSPHTREIRSLHTCDHSRLNCASPM